MRVLFILSVASSVSAWSFTWTNSDGKSYVENDNSPVSCQTIDHAEGKTFRWVPGDDGFSLWLWENDNCSGSKAGYSPPSPWTKAASRDLRSFRVADEDAEDEPEPTTTSTTTTTTTTNKPTTTTNKPTTVTVTQSAESTESTEEAESTRSEEEAESTTTEPSRSTESADSSSESTQSTEPTGSADPNESDESDESTETYSPSAVTPTSNADPTPTPASSTDETPSSEGTDSDKSSTPVAAIAGGTIGAIAAIAAIGALFFFLGRRRRSARDDPQPPSHGGTFGPGDKSDVTTTTTPLSVHPTPMYGAAAYNPASNERKMELDSAPVYQVMDSELPRTPVKQVYSPLDGGAVPYRPPATVVAELPGDVVMIEMSDAHRLNELDGSGSGRLKKW